MADYVSVANMALDKIGEDDQLRTPEDDKHTARTIAAVWNDVRRAALREHGWNFAARRRTLTAIASVEPSFPWTYRFQLPSESLRFVEALNLRPAHYEIEGKCLLCDSMGPIYIRCVIDEPIVANWDALFVDYFACKLALQIGSRIAGNNFDSAKVERELRRVRPRATGVDAQENGYSEQDLSGWEEAHLGYGSAS